MNPNPSRNIWMNLLLSRPEVAHDLLGGHALAGGDEDRVVLAALAQKRLRGRHVKYGDRRATDRVDGAVAGDSSDRVLTHRAASRHTDPVPYRVAVVRRGALVDHDLARGGGPVALGERKRIEALGVGVKTEAELPVLTRPQPLAVLADQLGWVRAAAEIEHGAGGGRDVAVGAHAVQQRGRHGGIAAGGVLDDLAAGDHRARLGIGVLEDGVERLVDGVGEDERAADHRDAEHDRAGRQHRAAATPPEAL
jgi:hypothetical protein